MNILKTQFKATCSLVEFAYYIRLSQNAGKIYKIFHFWAHVEVLVNLLTFKEYKV